ncbi:MAG TPA: VOC family protein [Ktedonobacteraceae bacterium]|nr:VOC family protein [Ktedonobacteraceae bacterium]
MIFHKVDATVLFVQNLSKSIEFYRDTLELPLVFQDSGSATFQMENQYFLLLAPSTATNLLSDEANPVEITGNARFLLATGVENVDATYETLKARGVTFLKPPISQPWGLRTAHFTDPEGNIREINQSLAAN